MPRWRLALGLLALAAYVAASHWLTVHAAAERWSLAAFAAPLWIAAALVGAAGAFAFRGLVGLRPRSRC